MPLMASNHSHSSEEEEDNRERQMKRQKKKLEREIKELETALEKQEARLSHLQSTAFQLANYYFVFQGVILTAICNRNTTLRCTDRWFLASLSALAATLNLAALVSIGGKYNRMLTQQARTWFKCNELQEKLSNLEEQENQRGQLSFRNLNGLSGRESLDGATSIQSGNDNHPAAHGWNYVDTSDLIKRQISFGICVIIFVSFAIIVFVACLKILCRDKNE